MTTKIGFIFIEVYFAVLVVFDYYLGNAPAPQITTWTQPPLFVTVALDTLAAMLIGAMVGIALFDNPFRKPSRRLKHWRRGATQ
jgi:hypothetical protein